MAVHRISKQEVRVGAVRHRLRALPLALACFALLSGCATSASSPSPITGEPTTSAAASFQVTASAQGTVTASVQTTGPAAQSASPTGGLGGYWVAPADAATIATSTITLTATPTTLVDVSFTRVVFSIAWGSAAPITACTATTGGSDGRWSCNADLFRLGAPLGPLTFTFDVFDSAGNVARSPAGPRAVTFAAAPSSPATVTWSIPCLETITCPGGYWPITVRWSAASGPVSGYRLYYTLGDVDYCHYAYWTPRGSAMLVATFGPTVLHVDGRLYNSDGKYSVAAYNAAGSSGATMSDPVIVSGDVVCP